MIWHSNGWEVFGKHLLNAGATIGEPQPTPDVSIEYLKELELVGFYFESQEKLDRYLALYA